ncbi:MAG: NAD(P)H-dependent glycerol-3-phosphate dehydrogenase [Mucinivorans sp.]
MIDNNCKIAVIGHGSWATALVKILIDSHRSVRWWVRNGEVREHIAIHGNNPKYLSQVHFSLDNITLDSDINGAVSAADIVILAAPSAFIQSVMADLTVPLTGKFVISAIKGIIPEQWLTVAEYVNQTFGLSFDNIGVITGPCHAEEVALERLSYLTMVGKDPVQTAVMGRAFAAPYIRVSTSNDIYGIEWAAVLKNIYAIAGGICHSIGYGDNFLAVLVSNAGIEIERFLSATYPFERDIMASAYVGDLLVTCYSQFSRNRTFGQMIGKGYSVHSAQMEMNMVAEGYYATACLREVKERGNYHIDMPIADAMYDILYKKKPVKTTINSILDKLI